MCYSSLIPATVCYSFLIIATVCSNSLNTAIVCYSSLITAIVCYSSLIPATVCYSSLIPATVCYSFLIIATVCSNSLITAIVCYSSLITAIVCYSSLIPATVCYSSLIPATVCYSSLIIATVCYSSLITATVCYSSLHSLLICLHQLYVCMHIKMNTFRFQYIYYICNLKLMTNLNDWLYHSDRFACPRRPKQDVWDWTASCTNNGFYCTLLSSVQFFIDEIKGNMSQGYWRRESCPWKQSCPQIVILKKQQKPLTCSSNFLSTVKCLVHSPQRTS